jgi:Concanavalin A-like lectin/glucanases superfamily
MHIMRWLLFFVLVPWIAFAQDSRQQLPTPDVSDLLLRGLVSWWRGVPGFTGGASMYDITPTRNNGTLTNMGFTSTSGWTISTRPGGTGQVSFDGVDDYVLIGDLPMYDFPDSTFSVEVSFRATAQGYLVARRTAASGGGGWFLRLDSPGILTARIVTASNTVAANNSTVTATLTNGAWYHAIVVFTTNTISSSSNVVTIYLNGVVDQGTPTPPADVYTPCNGGANCPVVFGVISDQGPGTWLTGSIDQVRIWNRPLSDGEIAALYAQWQRGDASLVSLPPTVMPAQTAAGVAQKPRKFFNTFR